MLALSLGEGKLRHNSTLLLDSKQNKRKYSRLKGVKKMRGVLQNSENFQSIEPRKNVIFDQKSMRN